ncbi:MAG: hypothetical protein ACE5D3_01925 [Candidatus Binatia bacterium]
MRFEDFIEIVPGPSVGIDRHGEVTDLARERLARSVQMRLRGSVDFGVDRRAAQRAQAIRVAAEGERLVIREEDQAAVLGAAAGSASNSHEPETIDDLFEPSSGVPKLSNGSLLFRTVSAKSMFGVQRQKQMDDGVERTVTDTLRAGIVDAFEESFDEVARRHPEEK